MARKQEVVDKLPALMEQMASKSANAASTLRKFRADQFELYQARGRIAQPLNQANGVQWPSIGLEGAKWDMMVTPIMEDINQQESDLTTSTGCPGQCDIRISHDRSRSAVPLAFVFPWSSSIFSAVSNRVRIKN